MWVAGVVWTTLAMLGFYSRDTVLVVEGGTASSRHSLSGASVARELVQCGVPLGTSPDVQGVQKSLQHGHAETREPRERNPQDRANRPAEQAEADHDRKTREPKERTHRTGDRQTEQEGADLDN